jgi:hypothetical protein
LPSRKTTKTAEERRQANWFAYIRRVVVGIDAVPPRYAEIVALIDADLTPSWRQGPAGVKKGATNGNVEAPVVVDAPAAVSPVAAAVSPVAAAVSPVAAAVAEPVDKKEDHHRDDDEKKV